MQALMRGVLGRSLRGNVLNPVQVSIPRAFGVDSKDAETHDDFKPQVKVNPEQPDVFASIKSDITANNVFIFMKGIPAAPMCGFSQLACRILDHYGVKYGAKNVLADPELRQGIKEFSQWPTVPQVYVKGEFLGGADILKQLHESGELGSMLEGCGGSE